MNLSWPDTRSAAKIMPHLIYRYHPKSVVDIGCGTGVWLREAIKDGVQDVIGIDRATVQPAYFPKESFIAADLDKEFPCVVRTFDLALCLEVAEHLPESRAEDLVSFLCKLSNVIIFSAAIPGQAGEDHQNCRWQTYWSEKFFWRKFSPMTWLRDMIWNDKEIQCYYRQNIICFEWAPAEEASPFHSVVHPDFYLYKLKSLDHSGCGL